MTECILVRTSVLAQKMCSGKRESVSLPHSMGIDEQWECRTLCAIKMKARTGGGGDDGDDDDDTCDHGLSRQPLRVKTSYQARVKSWKVEVRMKKKKKCRGLEVPCIPRSLIRLVTGPLQPALLSKNW